MTKKLGCGGCLGLLFIAFIGLTMVAEIARVANGPPPQPPVQALPVQAPSLTAAEPTTVHQASIQAPSTAVQVPSPPAQKTAGESNPESGKLRGTKDKDWDHTWVWINGKRVMAIFSVKLANNLTVGITYPLGVASAPVDQLPQGFLDSWGITGDVIDQRVDEVAEQLKAEQVEDQKRADAAALEARATNMGFKVVEVINSTELLGVIEYMDGPKFIHISGVDTSNLTDNETLSMKVWRDGVYRYVSVLGATSQIESYTAVPPQ